MSAGPALFARRRAGVLLHLSALPGPHGVGGLGPEAERFVDWCASAGLSLWQMLPVGPVGGGDSPYSATSSFAGEPLFVSLEWLAEDGLLPRARLAAPAALGRGAARYAVARAFRDLRLAEAFTRFQTRRGPTSRAYRAFVRRSAMWLPGWTRFAARRDGRSTAYHAFVQFAFATQWERLRAHARARGVHLVGDLPIFATQDSADVQDRPELFRLGRGGRPRVVTGVPPDMFSDEGQLWGHPHYAWAAHRAERFQWWIARVRNALTRFDALRIDHFVGLVHAYEIPGDSPTAKVGEWRPTPGRELLGAVRAALGPLPLIAEDLGNATPKVAKLREDFGLPGMKLLHNAFYEPDHNDMPHHHPYHLVVYPGTHDNDTTRAWFAQLSPEARERFLRVTGADPARPEDALLRMAWASPARTAIISMQDLLGLGAEARFNTPGTPEGNWRWRLAARAASPALAARLRLLSADAGRLPPELVRPWNARAPVARGHRRS